MGSSSPSRPEMPRTGRIIARTMTARYGAAREVGGTGSLPSASGPAPPYALMGRSFAREVQYHHVLPSPEVDDGCMVPDRGRRQAHPRHAEFGSGEAARPVENSLRQRELPVYDGEQARYGCPRHRSVACASWISGPQPCRENLVVAAQTPPRTGTGRSPTQKTSHRYDRAEGPHSLHAGIPESSGGCWPHCCRVPGKMQGGPGQKRWHGPVLRSYQECVSSHARIACNARRKMTLR